MVTTPGPFSTDPAKVTVPVKLAGNIVGYVTASVDQERLKSAYLNEGLQTAISITLLLLLVGMLAHAVLGRQKRRSAAQICNIARHDPLTGLPNRQSFIETLDDILARNGPRKRETAVMLVDVDQFMQINDALGHEGGDHVLCTVARRLIDGCPNATVARLGGDTFGVIVNADAVTAEAERIGGQILALMSEPVEWKNQKVQPLSSVGAVISPTDGRETSQLMRRAEHCALRRQGCRRQSDALLQRSHRTAI